MLLASNKVYGYLLCCPSFVRYSRILLFLIPRTKCIVVFLKELKVATIVFYFSFLSHNKLVKYVT